MKNLTLLKRILPYIILVTITFSTFLPSIRNSYLTWDDPMSLDYVLVRSINWEGVHKIFTTIVNTTYIPLTILSYAIEYHFFKYNFIVYHLNNVLLHVSVVLLGYIWLLRLGIDRKIAFLSLLIFAVHPMKVESVSWITERKDVLYSFFYLNALIAYLSYIKNKKILNYLLTLGLGILSMLSKPMALSLPLVLLLCDWYLERNDTWRCLWEKIPFFAYILPLAFITHSHNHNAVTIDENLTHALLIFVWSFSFYLVKFIFPFILVPMYATPDPISWANPAYFTSIIIFFTTLYLLYRNRQKRLIIFCFMFYISSIFFLLRFNKMENLGVVADRFIYLPSLGLCLIVIKNLEEYLKDKRDSIKILSTCLLSIYIIFLTFKTHNQQKIWDTNINLWNYVIKHEPKIAISYNNRGFSYIEESKLDLAEKDFLKALEIMPDYAFAYSNLGSINYIKKNYSQAVKYFNNALILDSTHAKSYNMLGLIYEETGSLDLAISKFSDAIQYSPYSEEHYLNRARVFKKKGLINESINDLKILISIFPDNTNAYMDLADIYISLNDLNSSLKTYQKAIAINPKLSQAYHNMGVLYATQGRIDQALKMINKSIEINPKSNMFYLNRSKILKKIGQLDQAYADAIKSKALGNQDTNQYILELTNEMQRK